jgi:sulfopyruvate decarboxylase subunit beta
VIDMRERDDRRKFTQRGAIALLARAGRENNALIVSEIGSQSVWLYASGDHPSYLYLSGPMGMASSVALGVAASLPNTPVLAICGDGSLAMNLGSLATISNERQPNLTLAVMDNGTYEFTGNLPSPSAGIKWRSVGETFRGFTEVCDFDGDADAPIAIGPSGGPRLIVFHVEQGGGEPPRLPLDGPTIHKRFKAYCEGLLA